jgi:hypothetical protein
MFRVIVKSPMSPPPAPDLKAPKLKWARNCDRPKSLCNNDLNIHNLLKFKFYLTDDLRINKINAVWHVSLWSAAPVSSSHDTGRSLDTTRGLDSGTFILF